MAGLNYGNSFRINEFNKKEGVFFMQKIKKYVVRIKSNGVISTMCSFSNIDLANQKYKELTNK